MGPARLPPMSGSRRRRAAGALCALTALAVHGVALAGCGTSVQQQQVRYADDLREVDASFTASAGQLLTSLSPGAPRAQAARAVGRFELQLATVETRLRTLHAPAEVAREQRHLVRSIDRYAAPVRLEVKALRSASPAALTRAGQRMLVATRALSVDVRHTVATIERILGAPSATSG